jgi:hypothetical protein
MGWPHPKHTLGCPGIAIVTCPHAGHVTCEIGCGAATLTEPVFRPWGVGAGAPAGGCAGVEKSAGEGAAPSVAEATLDVGWAR